LSRVAGSARRKREQAVVIVAAGRATRQMSAVDLATAVAVGADRFIANKRI
jgi:hypothetical protein